MAKVVSNKRYHHGDLRQSLIDAACKHLVESGADSLSLRALARELGVSQTAPYRHFESKAALFRAIALYGFQLVRDETSAVAEQYPDDPERALVEIGLAYLNFAVTNPEKYQLFFDSSLVDFNQSDELIVAGSAAFDVMTKEIQKGIDAGIFVDRPVAEPAAAIWASVHGMASLMMSKEPMMKEHENVQTNAKDAVFFMVNDPRQTIERFVKSIRKDD